jgi:hypothetical protein
MSEDQGHHTFEEKVLNRIDDLERLIIQSYRGVRKAMTQVDTDVKTLATNFAQATADQALLLTSLTTAFQNSTADNPSTDPLVVSITAAMQANHQAVLDTLSSLGIAIPPPTAATTAAVSKVAAKSVHGV